MVGCDKGLDIPVRPNLLKIDLSFPIYESTVPAARRFGQSQIFLEHKGKGFRFPAESFALVGSPAITLGPFGCRSRDYVQMKGSLAKNV